MGQHVLSWRVISGPSGRPHGRPALSYQQVLQGHMLADAETLIGDDFTGQRANPYR